MSKLKNYRRCRPGTVNMHRPADTANRATASSALLFRLELVTCWSLHFLLELPCLQPAATASRAHTPGTQSPRMVLSFLMARVEARPREMTRSVAQEPRRQTRVWQR